MAYDGTPSTWLSGWSENGTDITVPIATFPELTEAEADGTTGDIRKILYAILKKIESEYDALDIADKPTKMTVARSSSFNSDEAKHIFRITFYNAITAQEVADE